MSESIRRLLDEEKKKNSMVPKAGVNKECIGDDFTSKRSKLSLWIYTWMAEYDELKKAN